MSAPASAADLPGGFVRLGDVAPTIRQDMLYAGTDNFLGRPAAGYKAPVCILTRRAAEALAKVQAELAVQNQSLVVFDCYRPDSAVADFVRWVKQGGAVDRKWSPRTQRANLIRQGYIGARSAHSRGSTVDLAVVDTTADNNRPAPACGHGVVGMLNFGAGFDCFDPVSRVAAKVSSQAAANRRMLAERMAQAGFRPYAGEWWHFTLRDEPHPKQRFDFPVE